MINDFYEAIAPYYDLLHAELSGDIGLVLSLAHQCGGPVLELGCGTGRLLIPLAQAGHLATGVDLSPVMLDRARQRLAQEPEQVRRRVQLVRGDMSDFNLQFHTFALAMFSYNTLHHLEQDGAYAACRAIGRHLASRGYLFIDVANPMLIEQTPDDRALLPEQTLEDPVTGEKVLVLAGSRLHRARQKLHITWIFDLMPASGGEVRRQVANVTYCYYHVHQLELMLQECGYHIQEIYGDYEQAPFFEDSERLLILARRQ